MTTPADSGAGAPGAPSTFVSDAYRVSSADEVVEFYRKWAADYDAQMLGLGYTSHLEVARRLMAELPDRSSDILDIGCGTGLTCVTLAAHGYRNLDGIDLSPDMVRIAGERGIYRKLQVGDVTAPLAYGDASCDGVISSGTFTHGHVGPEPLTEIVRILRTGGVLACTVHMDLWPARGFEDAFDALVGGGQLECVGLEPGAYYRGREPEGLFCVYRRTD